MPRGTNPDLEKFLQMVFPWGEEYESLYKTVSWTFPPTQGVPNGGVANYSAQRYDDLMRLIETRIPRAKANVYVALGTFRVASVDKMTSDGFVKAVRQIKNVATHSSIYLDIDVGKDGAYATTDDAFAALDDFLEATGLPDASMEIQSGSGGLHVYWCVDKPMGIDTWVPLATALRDAAKAYGLKFDPQVTVNAAGILRVPTSLNHKRDVPTSVVLMQDSSFTRYTYKQLADCLSTYMTNTPTIQATPRMVPSANQQAGYTSNFTAGVAESAPVTLLALAQGCPMFEDTLARGGDGDPEPLWNLILLAATFTTDPVESAHELSKGDQRYNPQETDRKLQEKINARAQNPHIGWPRCAAFDAYSPTCATCKHRAEGKSPLNFAPKPVVQPVTTTPRHPYIPNEYEIDWNKHVFTNVWVGKDENRVPRRIDLLQAPVHEAGINPHEDRNTLVFKTEVAGKERYVEVAVGSHLSPQSCAEQFGKQGVYMIPAHHKEGRDFAVAWVQHLQQQKRFVRQLPYGWTTDAKGFVFDKTTYNIDGTEEMAFRGSSWDHRYAAVGDLATWQDSMKLVYGNPCLEALVATSFAAPLVSLVCTSSLIVSLYSHLSGVGKTTAMMLAQAVWGHPIEGMSALADTENSVIKKISDLRSLPVYWDELRTQDDMEKIVKLVFQITQGKAKARLTADIKQQPTASFMTMFAVASNYGIADSVYGGTEGTEAGGLRVFEMQAEKMDVSQFTNAQSQQKLIALTHNYGTPGARFASFVAKNKTAVLKILSQMADLNAKTFRFEQKERFWAQTITTIMVGARLANAAKITNFDIASMDSFLHEMMMRQRDMLVNNSGSTYEDVDSGELMLNEMIAHAKAKNQALFTSSIWYGRGSPQGILLSTGQDATKLGDVWIQIGEDGRIRAKAKEFDHWCRGRRLTSRRAMQLIKNSGYLVSKSKGTIGSGVMNMVALQQGRLRQHVYDLTPISSGSSPDFLSLM